MNKTRTRIYVKISPEKSEIVYSGIEFAEFVSYLSQPIENLMLITGGSSTIFAETNLERGLELFEGRNLIGKLTKQDIHNFGNFCCVDYAAVGNASNLSEEQIAELLYMGHMFKPLRSPFFEPLHNRFAYLAHDDGWYCKLYCRNICDFIDVLCKKTVAHMPIKSICEAPNDIKEAMLKLATEGLLVDLDEFSCKAESVETILYTVGEYSDMDAIQNNLKDIKSSASKHCLHCSKKEWSIS